MGANPNDPRARGVNLRRPGMLQVSLRGGPSIHPGELITHSKYSSRSRTMRALQLLRRSPALLPGHHVRTLSIAITPRCAQVRASLSRAPPPRPLALTRSCGPPRQRITNLNERREEGTLERMLRLSVEPGGCSGFSYKFEMADGSEVEDEDTCAKPSGRTRLRMYPLPTQSCTAPGSTHAARAAVQRL